MAAGVSQARKDSKDTKDTKDRSPAPASLSLVSLVSLKSLVSFASCYWQEKASTSRTGAGTVPAGLNRTQVRPVCVSRTFTVSSTSATVAK